jgi:hypothetical protein
MDNKKSFVLHVDSLLILDDLTDEQAGKLIKSMLSYYRDESIEGLDQLTKIALRPFINQFSRDSKKWEERAERSRINGLKGGRPKTQEVTNKPSGLSGLNKEPKEPVSVNVSVNDNVNVNGNVSVSEKTISKAKALLPDLNQNVFEVFDYWINTMQKPVNQTQLTPKRKKVITDRLKNGYSVDAIKAAIYNCSNDAFSMGDNDRCKPFNDIELICRTGEKLESFIERSNFKSKKDDPYNFAAIDAMTFDDF